MDSNQLKVQLKDADHARKTVRTELEPHLARSFSSIEVNRILLAIEEAMVNIFEHGYGGPGPVTLNYELQEDRIRIVIDDEAPLFDPTSGELPNPESLGEAGRPGGYGIYLMRTIMHVQHQSHSVGNRLILEKRLPGLKNSSEES